MLVWYRVLGACCTWKPLTYTAADTKIKTEAKRVLDEIMVASLFYEGKRKLYFNDIAADGRRRALFFEEVPWLFAWRWRHLPNHAVVFCWKKFTSAGFFVHVCLSGSSPSASHHEMEKMPKPRLALLK